MSFGAVGAQQQIPFGTWRLSLAEAISKSGGLVDTQADPASVFLYRGEARDVAEALGIDCTPYEGPVIPVIYTINLRDPAGLFLASSFEMRNKDILYASNSLSVESTKFMNYLNNVTSTIQGPISTVTSAYGLRNIIRGTGAVPSRMCGNVVAAASHSSTGTQISAGSSTGCSMSYRRSSKRSTSECQAPRSPASCSDGRITVALAGR